MHHPHLFVGVASHIFGDVIVRDGRNAFATIISLVFYGSVAGGFLIFAHLLRVHPVVDAVYDWGNKRLRRPRLLELLRVLHWFWRRSSRC